MKFGVLTASVVVRTASTTVVPGTAVSGGFADLLHKPIVGRGRGDYSSTYRGGAAAARSPAQSVVVRARPPPWACRALRRWGSPGPKGAFRGHSAGYARCGAGVPGRREPPPSLIQVHRGHGVSPDVHRMLLLLGGRLPDRAGRGIRHRRHYRTTTRPGRTRQVPACERVQGGPGPRCGNAPRAAMRRLYAVRRAVGRRPIPGRA